MSGATLVGLPISSRSASQRFATEVVRFIRAATLNHPHYPTCSRLYLDSRFDPLGSTHVLRNETGQRAVRSAVFRWNRFGIHPMRMALIASGCLPHVSSP